MSTEPTAPQSLVVRRGEAVRAAHHNALVNLAARITLQRGQLKGRQTPDGFMPRVQISQTTSVDYAFKMSVGEDDDGNTTVTFTSGFVNGIVPIIDGIALDDFDADGDPPQLVVTDDAWAPHGRTQRALIMFRYDLDKNFDLIAVTPVAVPAPPTQNKSSWYKLVGTLTDFDGVTTVAQQMFFSQYFTAGANASVASHFTAYPRAGA